MTLDETFTEVQEQGFTLQHLGTEGPNCQWTCQLIKSGEFYNGTAWTPIEALTLALIADPYIPTQQTYTAEPAKVDLSFILANLRKSRPPEFTRRL